MKLKIESPVRAALAVALAALLGGCSLEDMVVGKLADSLSAGMGTSFTGEDDPELVGDALPFALKLYDSLLEKTPRHVNLLLAAGSAYVMYANAYVQAEAEMLPRERRGAKQAMLARAKRLSLRGSGLVMRALNVAYPGFRERFDAGEADAACAACDRQAVPFLYWACAGRFAAYAADVFDVELSLSLPRYRALMEKALALDEAWNRGAIHDFFISYYAAMPAGLGGDDAKARAHFERAVAVSGGRNPSPYVSLATALCVKNQDEKEFRELLARALAVDPDDCPDRRLATIVTQKKARWYLDHAEDFFL